MWPREKADTKMMLGKKVAKWSAYSSREATTEESLMVESANNALCMSADLFRGVASTSHISLSAKHFPMVYGTAVALTKMYKHSLVYYEKMSLKVPV